MNDITLNERSGEVQVRQEKGWKARAVLLNKDAQEALQAWLSVRTESNYAALFLSQKGRALSERAISERVRDPTERLKVEKVSPHTLRHSFVKNLVDTGVGMEKVVALLEHTNLNTTRRYISSVKQIQAGTEKVVWGRVRSGNGHGCSSVPHCW
jgi:integrase/recombinase XerC